jgi:hypothetical protein
MQISHHLETSLLLSTGISILPPGSNTFYPRLPPLAIFFCIRSRAKEPDAPGKGPAGHAPALTLDEMRKDCAPDFHQSASSRLSS